MAQCKYCGRKGFFLSVDANGLCKNCQPIVIMDIQQRVRILSDSINLAKNSKTFKTRLSRCDLVIEHAEALLEYEKKGIPTISPLPSKLLKEFSEYHDTIIIEEAMQIFGKAQKKAEVSTSFKTIENTYVNALLKIDEVFSFLKDKNKGIELKNKLKSLIHSTKLNGFIDVAKKAEFKGQIKKAVDQYQEALYFILNDNIPDEQQKDKIQEIENKINSLSEKLKK